MTQGSHIGYKEVKVLYGENGENGFCKHIFRSPLEQPDALLSSSKWPFGNCTSYDWKRGQLLSSVEHNQAGQQQQRIANGHIFRQDQPTTKSYRALNLKTYNGPIALLWTDFVNPYEVISEWTHVGSDTVTFYDSSGGTPVATTKRYFYENSNHVQLTRIVETNSDNAKRLTSLKYPLDYTNAPTSVDVATIDSLKTKHIHNAVIQKVVRQQKSGQTDSSVFSAELVKFKKFATGQFLPFEIYKFDSTAFLNLTDGQLFNTSGGTFNKHVQYKRQLTNEQYDAYGNPTQVKDANNISTTAIFAYNSSLPIARIGNATPTDAMTCIFDDGSAANWTGGAGTWTVANGVYQQTSNTAKPWNVPQRYTNVSIDDAVLEADIRFDDTSGDRYVALAKYISASGNIVRFVMRRTASNPGVYIYAKNTAPDSSAVTAKTFNLNQWYHLRGEIQGNVAKLYLDGVLLVTWTNSQVDIANGNIGLCTNSSKASFDNVRFYPPTALAFSASYDAKFLAFNTLTDENGFSQRFTYDNFGRLQTSQDALGRLLQEISYFYSNPFSSGNPNYVKATLATHGEHVRNHDFETGSAAPDHWAVVPPSGSGVGTWDNTVSYSGAKALKAYIPSAGAGNRVLWRATFDEKVSSKEMYRLEIWAQKATGSSGGSISVDLKFHNTGHSQTETKNKTISLSSLTTTWQKFTLDFTPLTTTDHLYEISIDFTPNSYGTVWYDRANFYELNTTKTFADGLGREIQTLQREGSSAIKAGTIYDAFSRVSKVTKPFTPIVANPDTNLTPAAIDSANAYYASRHPAYYSGLSAKEFDTGSYAYSQTEYYQDPLNRPKKQAAPGTAFRLGTGKEVKFDYLVNAGGEVPGYAANLLVKQRQTDENGNVVDAFTDKFGNTIASIVDPTGLNFKTKFEYDVLGNLLKSKTPNANATPPNGDSTRYAYTTLSRLRQKISADAGTVDYLYDRNRNLRFVKDAKGTAGNYFIYYKYDSFNRIIEEGTMTPTTNFTQVNADNTSYPTSGNTVKVKYQYDATTYAANGPQRNLRGRLDAIEYVSDRFPSQKGYIFYSYDNNGNLEWVDQYIPTSNSTTLNTRTDYQYDVLGKVTKIYFRRTFPPGASSDAFYVWYDYDALGRLEKVHTNTADLKVDPPAAQYTYWPGSQVRRLALGNNLQGVDYLYNSRDWLTQINHHSLVKGRDPGNDTTNTTGMKVDRFGEIIGYNKMKHIAFDSDYAADTTAQFNGNIAWLTTNIYGMTSPPGASLNGWVYKYDKANRLTKGNWGYNTSALGTNWSASTFYDLPAITYDRNGNLSTMTRNNQSGAATNMTYNYTANTNKLHQVAGLNGQGTNNYVYDANGNMTKDIVKLGSGSTITYDYRNLPNQVPVGANNIYFGYDGNGQRVSKNNLFYVPGADGRVIAVYDDKGTHLYWNLWGLDLLGQRFWKQ